VTNDPNEVGYSDLEASGRHPTKNCADQQGDAKKDFPLQAGRHAMSQVAQDI
jgi:hypothetical protein